MKKSVNIKLVLIVILAVFFILLFSIVINAELKADKDYNSDGVIDAKDNAYMYGQNIDEFYKLPPIVQQNLLSGEKLKVFTKGLLDSIDENKVSKENAQKNLDKLVELWGKNDEKGKYVFTDDTKNKIWQGLDSSKKEDYLKKITNKFFNEKYKGAFKDPSKVGIKEIKIDDKDNKLKWEGNKLGTAGKDGKLNSWLDLENPPRWLNKIEFKENKFTLGFFTGFSTKEVSFNAGTIGANGEVIGPDGKVVGVKMNNNIKSINYVNNAFEIEYIIKDKNGKEVVSKITIREQDIPQNSGTFSDLFKSIKDPVTGPIVQDLFKKINAINKNGGMAGAGELAKDLNGMGFDLFLSGGVEYQLNVMYGESRGKTEKIDLNFDNGKLKASVSNGGALVTTDSKGNALVGYTQFFSSGGLINQNFNSDSYLDQYNQDHPNAKLSDESGEFIFGTDGYIEAAKNGIVTVKGLGKAETARDEFIGIDIHRNPYVDAIIKGDIKSISEAVAKEGYRALEDILGGPIDPADIVNNPQKYKDKFQNLDVKTKLIDLLRKNIEDPSVSIDLKRQLERALDIGLQNLERNTQNIGDLVLAGGRTDLTAEENLVGQSAQADMRRFVDRSLRDVLSDSSKMQTLISGSKEDKEKIVQDVLIKNAQTVFNDYIYNSLTQPLVDAASASASTSTANNPDNALIKEKVDQLTKDAFEKYVMKGGNLKEALRSSVLNKDTIELLFKAELINKPNLTPAEQAIQKIKQESIRKLASDDKLLDSLAESIDATYSLARTSIIDEATKRGEIAFKEFIRDINTRPQEYGNRIVIDMKNKEVYAMGNKYIRFDAETALSKFTAYSSSTNKEDVIVLNSNGNYVASFRGSETYMARIVPAVNYFSIGSIVNHNNPNFQLKLDNLGQGYRLYDSGMTVSTGRTVTGSIVGPLFGILKMKFPIAQVDISGSETDPGVNPNAAISFQFTAGMDKGRIFNWLMNWQLKKKYGSSAIPLGTPISKAQPFINQGFADFINAAGGYDQYQNFVSLADDAFKLKDQYNINIPRDQELRDAYTIARAVQKDQNGLYYSPDVQKMLNFLSQQKMSQGSKITITNTYIQVNGNKFTDADPALFRTLVRAGYYGQGRIPGNVPLN